MLNQIIILNKISKNSTLEITFANRLKIVLIKVCLLQELSSNVYVLYVEIFDFDNQT